MGVKDLDALAKTIKPFRQDICQTAVLNTWTDNGVPSSSAGPVDSSNVEIQSNNQRHRQRRPDRAVYVPRGRRSQTTPPTAPVPISGDVTQAQVLDKESLNVIPVSNSSHESSQSSELAETNSQKPGVIEVGDAEVAKVQEPVIETKQDSSKHQSNSHSVSTSQEVKQSPPPPPQPQATDSIANMAETNVKSEGDKIETPLNSSDKDYNEEKEFQRASKEINRRNRRIIKQTFDSDVLEISESPASMPAKQSPPATAETKLPKKSNLPQSEAQSLAKSTVKKKESEKSNGKSAVDAETDDWESIFDDDGECLDPKVMTEITANVGKVTITKPKNDYKSYKEPVNLDDEEFPHVLEVSNFPIEFKTPDLMMIFSEYKDSGYDIKWVDDTHALVVFSSSKIAARALSTGHSFVKLKPLTQATAESRARAKKSALYLQPYRQRPETCAALARRLVTGALGVRLSTAREEREIERRVLKEAKERKLLAAKLRDEAWED